MQHAQVSFPFQPLKSLVIAACNKLMQIKNNGKKVPFGFKMGGINVAPVESVGKVKTWSKMSANKKHNTKIQIKIMLKKR